LHRPAAEQKVSAASANSIEKAELVTVWVFSLQAFNCAEAALKGPAQARAARKMLQGKGLWDRSIETLRGGLSPEQASDTLQRLPNAVHISHMTTHTALCAIPRGELRRQFLARLARAISKADDRTTLALIAAV